MTTSTMAFIVFLSLFGLLVFFKPILLYRNMKSGGKGVSFLNMFMTGLSYFAIAAVLYFVARKGPENKILLTFSIILIFLGIWNIIFAFLIRKLNSKNDEIESRPEDEEQLPGSKK